MLYLKLKILFFERMDPFMNINIIKFVRNGIICQLNKSMIKYKQKYHKGRLYQEKSGFSKSYNAIEYNLVICLNRWKSNTWYSSTNIE